MSTHYKPHIVTNGLVMYLDAANTKSYPGSGDVWTDLSGNENHGTKEGAGTITNVNGAMYYGGFSNNLRYFNCGDSASLKITGTEITLETWIKTSFDGSGTYWPAVISKRYSYGDGNVPYTLGIDNTVGARRCLLNLDTNSGYLAMYSQSGNKLNDDEWHHMLGVYDGSNAMIYIDGQLDATSGLTGNIINVNYPVYIGGSNLTGNPYFAYNYQDYIAMAKIYNRALTSSEILQNYNATKGRFGY